MINNTTCQLLNHTVYIDVKLQKEGRIDVRNNEKLKATIEGKRRKEEGTSSEGRMDGVKKS